MCKFVQCYICTPTIEFHCCLDTILVLCFAFFLAGVVNIVFQVEQFGQKPKGSYLKLTIKAWTSTSTGSRDQCTQLVYPRLAPLQAEIMTYLQHP